jgi:hypothetical protein
MKFLRPVADEKRSEDTKEELDNYKWNGKVKQYRYQWFLPKEIMNKHRLPRHPEQYHPTRDQTEDQEGEGQYNFSSRRHVGYYIFIYEGVSKSFRTGRLERELQMVQLSATGCSFIAILWVSLVSFAAITLCVASQRVFIVVYFLIDSVRKLLDTPSYIELKSCPLSG